MIFGMNIKRPNDEAKLLAGLSRAPAVVLLGPRQIGKTTMARELGSQQGALYLDLERAADLRRLDDPDTFLRSHSDKLIILDEVHRAPALFPELRGVIDERRQAGQRTGQFLLLGSASLDLMQQSAETLAGRVAYMELGSINAEDAIVARYSVEQLWVRGGFPESLCAADDQASLDWRLDFIRSYLERDVRLFAPRLPAAIIGRLWTMLANGQGSLLNTARLGQSLGVSAPTAQRYVDLLVDLLLVRRLPPYSANIGKRLVRAPKLYIRDSGLVHALLEIGNLDALLGHPVVGASWEGFIIESLIAAAGSNMSPYFYRTHDGAEIDLIFEHAGKPVLAIEVKRSSAPTLTAGFHRACDDLAIPDRWVVAPIAETYPMKNDVLAFPLLKAIDTLRQFVK
jgi:predicted AAA+ superfamily ATPase